MDIILYLLLLFFFLNYIKIKIKVYYTDTLY